VVLSRSFFEKQWTQRELNGLAARESGGVKVILPVWHEIDAATVAGFSPMLAGRIGISSQKGIETVADLLTAEMKG